MSELTFETVFPGFADPHVAQPFDTREEADAHLARLKTSFEPIFARIEAALAEEGGAVPPEEAAHLLEAGRELAQAIDASVVALIKNRVPSAEATANTDFVIENAAGMPVFFEELEVALRAAPEETQAGPTLRVANLTLEQNFLALLDQLTAKRIAEELDTPTYLERLRGGFKRVHDGAVLQADKLELELAPTDLVDGRLAIATDLATFLQTEVAPRLTQTESNEIDDTDADFTRVADALVTFTSNCQRYINHLKSFLAISLRDLRTVHQKFCAEANRAGAEGECRLVSAEIERRAMFRPMPLVWAVIITLLVKIILAQNTSETLHYQAVPLLILSFVGTWVLSIAIGVSARNGRMRDLQRYTRKQLRQMLSVTDKDAEIVAFPALNQDATFVPQPSSPAFTFRGKAMKHKVNVALLNGFLLFIPLLLGAIVFLTSNKELKHDFIARFPDTGPCVLANGRLVFATPSTYYVRTPTEENGVWKWALSNILPEITAEVVDRSRVISVRRYASPNESRETQQENEAEGIAAESLLLETGQPPSGKLRGCEEIHPKRQDIVQHRGNAMGVLGTQSALDSFSENTDRLIEALGGAKPININLGGQIGDIPAAITVDLGETSLNALSPNWFDVGAPGLTDPVIVEALAILDIELSKTVATEVDINRILTALEGIRRALGGDMTVTQALSIALGRPAEMPSTLNLPPAVVAFLDTQSGEGGFLAELEKLRVALETTNQIATDISLRMPAAGESNPFVVLLEQQLPLMLEKQDQLISVLSTGSGTGTIVPVVVTPMIFGSGGEGTTRVAGPISQNFFQTTIEVAGSAVESETLGNALVLPFFPGPVSASSDTLDDPQKSFDWGADPDNLNDPDVSGLDNTYFSRIATALTRCLVDDATLSIDVIGLASRSWEGPIVTHSKDELNYYLAEGRRLAALERLGRYTPSALQSRIMVQIVGNRTASLSDILGFDERENAAAFIDTYGLFNTRESFEQYRDDLLGLAHTNTEISGPLEELFARSVVLRLVSTSSEICPL